MNIITEFKKIEKWTTIEVRWLDSVIWYGWQDPTKLNEADLKEDMEFQSVGYFFQLHKDMITMVMSHRQLKHNGKIDSVGEVLCIPVNCITSVKTI